MSADVLLQAAALMRERAGAATPGPYFIRAGYEVNSGNPKHPARVANTGDPADAEHIASWHPAVALAVADWLDEAAGSVVHGFDPDDCTTCRAALAVARAYLGSES